MRETILRFWKVTDGQAASEQAMLIFWLVMVALVGDKVVSEVMMAAVQDYTLTIWKMLAVPCG